MNIRIQCFCGTVQLELVGHVRHCLRGIVQLEPSRSRKKRGEATKVEIVSRQRALRVRLPFAKSAGADHGGGWLEECDADLRNVGPLTADDDAER